MKITGEGNNLVLDLTPAYQPTAKFGYPIIPAGYANVCARYPDAETGQAVKAFLKSAVTIGQTDLNGYIALPTEFQIRVASAVNSVE